MDRSIETPLFVAFVVVAGLFVLFSGGAMTGGMMNGGLHVNGWLDDRGWMWTPALLTFAIGLVLAWAIYRRKI
jgi:hypothetical protein